MVGSTQDARAGSSRSASGYHGNAVLVRRVRAAIRCALPDDACANQRKRHNRKTYRNPSAHVSGVPRISEDLDANEEADGGTEQDAEQVRRGVVQSRKALILGHGHPGRCYHHDEQKKRP